MNIIRKLKTNDISETDKFGFTHQGRFSILNKTYLTTDYDGNPKVPNAALQTSATTLSSSSTAKSSLTNISSTTNDSFSLSLSPKHKNHSKSKKHSKHSQNETTSTSKKSSKFFNNNQSDTSKSDSLKISNNNHSDLSKQSNGKLIKYNQADATKHGVKLMGSIYAKNGTLSEQTSDLEKFAKKVKGMKKLKNDVTSMISSRVSSSSSLSEDSKKSSHYRTHSNSTNANSGFVNGLQELEPASANNGTSQKRSHMTISDSAHSKLSALTAFSDLEEDNDSDFEEISNSRFIRI